MKLARVGILLLIVEACSGAIGARAQSPPVPKAPATIVGRVVIGGNGMPGAEVLLKPGERLMKVQVTLATGASGLSGRLTAQQAKTSGRSRVHLIPSEPEAQNNTLRFAEVPAGGDGSFSFGNLAPGKYWLLVRPVSGSHPNDGPARPAAWDSVERAKLRREAAAANALIELKPCQRMTDYALP